MSAAHDGRDCGDLAERIERFLDGALDAREEAELDVHLTRCLPCSDERDLRARIRALIRDGCAEPVPDDLAGRIRAHLAGVLATAGPDPLATDTADG
jgi:anti-sigma factor (TIGR02949 family)